MRRALRIAAIITVASILFVPGASFYYESNGGRGCASCHEMTQMYGEWHASSHREVACDACHGGALTLNPMFHLRNAARVFEHAKGDVPEQVGFANDYVQAMTERCRNCHRQEYAAWHAGPHSATYSRIFLDKDYNSKNMLMDDCLRCHGMHFERGINDLVAPVDRTGPWTLKRVDMAQQPSMPCLTCHQMHRKGPVLRKSDPKGDVPGPVQDIAPSSLAFFDRRTQQHIPAMELPMPAMLEGSRPVEMSPDRRQTICYQCHAPVFDMQVGSGDDRTAVGVHEGISCLACHAGHGQTTRASCATCHPKMSNCGLDVEKMDTTFRSAKSRHNIHWVKCVDCHGGKVPKKKAVRVHARAGHQIRTSRVWA